jgi:hypothetical protein
MLAYKPANLLYCVVPKAACTSWIRIFRFLQGEIQFKRSPLEISKLETHYGHAKYRNALNLRKPADVNYMKTALRMMTVRDPYARLWSAYIDKLMMPDFWRSRGRTIIGQERRTPNKKSVMCGHDVTFPEFIRFVTHIKISKEISSQDKHWLPASTLCDPCPYRPAIVAKVESLSRDMDYVFNLTGMSWVITSISGPSHTDYEVEDQLRYLFSIASQHQACANNVLLLKRLWQAFQFNGYLPLTDHYPEVALSNMTNLTVDVALKIIKQVRQNWHPTVAEVRQQRRHALVTAYSTVPLETLKRVQKLFRRDFELFGYEAAPHDIFHHET